MDGQSLAVKCHEVKWFHLVSECSYRSETFSVCRSPWVVSQGTNRTPCNPLFWGNLGRKQKLWPQVSFLAKLEGWVSINAVEHGIRKNSQSVQHTGLLISDVFGCWLSDRIAKEKKLRLWKNFQPVTAGLPIAEKAYMAKVCWTVLLRSGLQICC